MRDTTTSEFRSVVKMVKNDTREQCNTATPQYNSVVTMEVASTAMLAWSSKVKATAKRRDRKGQTARVDSLRWTLKWLATPSHNGTRHEGNDEQDNKGHYSDGCKSKKDVAIKSNTRDNVATSNVATRATTLLLCRMLKTIMLFIK